MDPFLKNIFYLSLSFYKITIYKLDVASELESQ